MNEKVRKTIWYSLTVAAGLFGIVWTWVAQPIWWPSAVSMIVMLASFVLGAPWNWPEGPPS